MNSTSPEFFDAALREKITSLIVRNKGPAHDECFVWYIDIRTCDGRIVKLTLHASAEPDLEEVIHSLVYSCHLERDQILGGLAAG